MKRVLYDLEGDGFLDTLTTIHCLAAVDVDTRQRAVFGPSEIDAACEYLDSADVLIGHNHKRYDLPALLKVKKWRPRKAVELLDTLVMARTLFPDLASTDYELILAGKMPNKLSDGKNSSGKHTLEAWGYRLGERKAHFEGPWDKWTQEMQDYMIQDVTTNWKLWQHLTSDEGKRSPHNYAAFAQALELEHRIAELCGMIEDAGVPFDKEAAGKLHTAWVAEQETLAAPLIAQFGTWCKPVSPNPTKHIFTPKRDNAKMGYVAGASMCKLEWVEFNPGSRDHIRKVLTDRGWKPDSDQMTPGGKGKIDEKIVAGLTLRYPELGGLGRYMMLGKRISQLATGDEAWLAHVKADGCIHGVVNPMGTITSRASHFAPNLGQVPATKKPYGKECRGLFHVPEGWELVGADMEGLELRGLAHYLHPYDEGAYAELLLSGDPHWRNSQLVGLADSDVARDAKNPVHTVIRESGGKRYTYACIYGCGGKRGGEIILGACLDARPLDDGALYKRFFGDAHTVGPARLTAVGKRAIGRIRGGIKGFQTLQNNLEWQVKHFNWVPGLDGRRVPARSAHSALNFLIQSAGAILCKRWGVDAVSEMQRLGLRVGGWGGDVVPVLWVHDEYQFAVRKGLAETVGPILVECAQRAGDAYSFRVRLDSKYVVGRNWAETH